MAFAPTHQLLATETGIGAQNDSYFRPRRSHLRYDTLDLFQATCGRIGVRGPQTRTQQMLTGKNVERQIAVVVVIAMEEAVLLVPMQRHIRRVEIENDSFRSLGMGLQPQIH